MAVSEPPFREPFLTEQGFVSPRWQTWITELVRAIRALEAA